MNRKIPLLAGVFLLVASVAYWIWTQRPDDAQPGVQLAPSSPAGEPQDEESVEDLGESGETEDSQNTFEMSEEGAAFPEDEAPMDQEVDGPSKGPEIGTLPDGQDAVETIDDEEGETVEAPPPSKSVSSDAGTTIDPSPGEAAIETDKDVVPVP